MSFISKERVRLEEGGEGIFGIKKKLVYLIFSERISNCGVTPLCFRGSNCEKNLTGSISITIPLVQRQLL